MTARPMTEVERALAIEAAERLVARDEIGIEPGHMKDGRRVAQALLSTSAAERGMREALEGCYALILRDYSDQRAAALEGHPIARDARDVWDRVCDALAALSSAPTTDTKGASK